MPVKYWFTFKHLYVVHAGSRGAAVAGVAGCGEPECLWSGKTLPSSQMLEEALEAVIELGPELNVSLTLKHGLTLVSRRLR